MKPVPDLRTVPAATPAFAAARILPWAWAPMNGLSMFVQNALPKMPDGAICCVTSVWLYRKRPYTSACGLISKKPIAMPP